MLSSVDTHTGTRAALNGGSVASTSPERDRAAMQEQARQLLEQRRRDPAAHQYSPEEAAAMKARGRQLLQQHQQAQQSFPASSLASAQGNQETVTAPTANPPEEGETKRFTEAEVEDIKADLIAQFNAHMSQCEQDNQAYWQQTTEAHMQELEAVAAERDAAKQQINTLEASLARLQADLAQSQDFARDMEERNHELESSNRALREELSAAQEEIARLHAENAATQQAVDELTRELTEARAEAAGLQRELAAAVENAQARQQVASLEALLAQDRDVISSLEAAKLSVEKDCDDLQAQLAEERSTSATHAQEAAALREEVSRLEADLLTATEERVAAQHAVETLGRLHQEQEQELQQARAERQQSQQQPQEAPPSQREGRKGPLNPFASEDEEPAAPPAPAPAAEGAHDAGQQQQWEALVQEAEARATALQERLVETTALLRDAEANCASLAREDEDAQRMLDEARARVHELEGQVAELEAAAAAASASAHDRRDEVAEAGEEELFLSGRGSGPRNSRDTSGRGGNPFATASGRAEPVEAQPGDDDGDNGVHQQELERQQRQRMTELEDELAQLRDANESLRARVAEAEANAGSHGKADGGQEGGLIETPPPTYEDSTALWDDAPAPLSGGAAAVAGRGANPFAVSSAPELHPGEGNAAEDEHAQLDDDARGVPRQPAPAPHGPQSRRGNPFLHDDTAAEEEEEELVVDTEGERLAEAKVTQLEEALRAAHAQIEKLRRERDSLAQRSDEAQRTAENLDAEVGVLRDALHAAEEAAVAAVVATTHDGKEDENHGDVVKLVEEEQAEEEGSPPLAADDALEQLRSELDTAHRRIANLEAELALAGEKPPSPSPPREEDHDTLLIAAAPDDGPVTDTQGYSSVGSPPAGGPVAALRPGAAVDGAEDAFNGGTDEEVMLGFPDEEGDAPVAATPSALPPPPPLPPVAKSHNPFATLGAPPAGQGRRDSFFGGGDADAALDEHARGRRAGSVDDKAGGRDKPPAAVRTAVPSHNPFLTPPPSQPDERAAERSAPSPGPSGALPVPPPPADDLPLTASSEEDDTEGYVVNPFGNPSTRPASNGEGRTASSSSSSAGPVAEPSLLMDAEEIRVDPPPSSQRVEDSSAPLGSIDPVTKVPHPVSGGGDAEEALARLVSLAEERDRLQDEADELRKRVQVLEAGQAALASIPRAEVPPSLTNSFAMPTTHPSDAASAALGSSLRSNASGTGGRLRERELERQVWELQKMVDKLTAPQRSTLASTSQPALHEGSAHEESGEWDAGAAGPSMEVLGRKYADTQLKLRLARAEIRELHRRLGESSEGDDENEEEEEGEEVEAPFDATSQTAGTECRANDARDEEDGAERISSSARTVRQGRAAVADTDAPQASVNPFAELPEEGVDGAATELNPASENDHGDDSAPPADDADEDGVDNSSSQEDLHTRAATAEPQAADDNMMKDFGRKYADAQHKLELAEETRAALESEVAELRERVAELEQAAATTAPPVNASGADVLHEDFADVDREELLEHIRTLEAQIAQVDEQQEQELAELAEEAAERVAETEQFYQQRLEELEAALAAQLLRDGDERHPSNQLGDARASRQGNEEKLSSSQRTSSSAAHAHAEEPPDAHGPPPPSSLAEAEAEVASLREEVGRLRDALEEVEAAMAHRDEEHEVDMKLVAEEIDKQFTLRDEQQEAHLAQEARYREEIAELTHMIAQLRQDLDDQHTQHLQRHVQTNTEEASTSAARSAEHSLENTSEAQVAELQAQLAAAEQAAAHANDANKTLQVRFDQLQTEYDAFLKDTEALRGRQTEQLQLEQAANETRHGVAAAQLEELRRHLHEMEEQVRAAREDAEARDARLVEAQSDSQATRNDLEARVRTLTDALAVKQGELDDLNTANEELAEMLKRGATSVESALQERQAQLDAALRQLREAQLQLSGAKDALAQREAAVEALKVAEEELHRQILQHEARRRELENELREARRACQEEQRSSAQRQERLSRELERQQHAAASQLAELRDAHTKEVAQLQHDLDAVRDELQVAETLAATLPLEGQKFQNRFEALKQQLTEALQSNNELHAELKAAREDAQRQRATARRGDGSGGEESSDARMNALLERNELLEGRLRALTEERNAAQQDRDALLLDVKNAKRVAEVKEQAMRRQENELRQVRAQMAAVREDLSQRVQGQRAMEQELAHVTEHAAQLANAYEDLQGSAVDDANRCDLLEEEVALLEAKQVSIPRLVEAFMSGITDSYTELVRVSQQERRRLDERCAVIEKTAMDAMVEGERQHGAYEAALADARDEQAEMRTMMEDMAVNLKAAEEALAEAVEQTKAARSEVAETKHRAYEDVFAAQRDRQAAELAHADALHQLSLLEEELATAARTFDKQRGRFEKKEKEQEAAMEALRDALRAKEAAAREARERGEAAAAAQAQFVETCVAAREEAVREAARLRAQLDRALPRLAQLEEERAARGAELMDTAQRLSALSQKSSTEGEVTRRHMGELNATLQQLSQAHATLQQAHNVTEATADRLKNQLAATEQDLQRATNRCDQLTRELAATSGKLRELEAAYARDTGDAQARLRDDERRLKGLTERNEILQEEQQVLQEALHKANAELAATADNLRRVTDEHNALKLHQGRLLDSLRQRGSELEEQLAALQESDDRLRVEHDACQRAAQQHETELERVKQYLADANRHNEALHRHLAAVKESHEAELAEAQETLADAQKELGRCRKAIADAESKQLEMEHTIYALRGENGRWKEEIAQLRGAAEKAQQTLQKEQFERQEVATLLQSQIAQLYEDVRTKQAELKAQQQATAHLEDAIASQQRELEEAREYNKALKKDLERARDETSVLKEMHRRERNELQAQLDDAQDAEEAAKRSLAQHKEKTTAKLEMYEVTEQNLRQEITDLRADVVQLEESLARATQGKHSAETNGSRQGLSLRAAEEELRALRAQTAKDMTELADLRVQLRQRGMELERAKRDAQALVATERAKAEAAQRTACEQLEAALKKEHQATLDARAARDRALAALDQRQREQETQEAEDAAVREELRQLQRDADVLRHYIRSIHTAAGQAAREVGISCGADEADNAAMTTADGPSHSSDVDSDSVDVQKVLDGLLDELHVYTFAARTLELEDAQLDELRRAGAVHADLMKTISDLSAHEDTADGGGVTGAGTDVAVTPIRAGVALTGLNTSGTVGRTPPHHPAEIALSQPPPPPPSGSQGLRSPSCHALVQHMAQASATIGHRLTDHASTMQELLRSLAVAMGVESSHRGAPQEHADEVSRATAATASALAARGVNAKALAAAGPRAKLLISATTAELHRRIGTANRALQRVLEAHQHVSSAVSVASASSSLIGRPPGPRGPQLLPILQEAQRVLRDTEEFLLRPFNELLLGDVPSFMAAGTLSSSTPPPPSSFPAAAAAAAAQPSPARRSTSPPPPSRGGRMPRRAVGEGDRWL